MDKIRISDLEVRCIIGTRDVEREHEQKVVINIVLECDFTEAAKSDDIADTVNYKELKDSICEFVHGSRFYLLEKLAEEVASICLSAGGVKSANVSIDKPGALTGARTVGVEITRSR